MKIVRGIPEMQALRRELKGSVGLVPTMGYLHRGHMALVGKSQEFNAFTIVSMFVNPTQFGPQEDFAKYPRDEQHDIKLLEDAGVDVLFIPSADEMYPDGFDSWVEVRGITDTLEGARRTWHFLGVATICNKLFNITAPHRAYFGQKDAQQVQVVRKMVRDLNMSIEIDVVPTIREEDGLAMSSRNTYLSIDERRAAAVLYKALLKAREMCAFGERDAKKITGGMTAILQSEPLVKVDYVAITDSGSLQEIEYIQSSALVSMAVFIGRTRLIDNITVTV